MMKMFNLTSSQIVISQMTNQKHHPKLSQINHIGHAGCVQNDVSKMIGLLFWWLFKMGFSY
jgi:hypothetical protein